MDIGWRTRCVEFSQVREWAAKLANMRTIFVTAHLPVFCIGLTTQMHHLIISCLSSRPVPCVVLISLPCALLAVFGTMLRTER